MLEIQQKVFGSKFEKKKPGVPPGFFSIFGPIFFDDWIWLRDTKNG